MSTTAGATHRILCIEDHLCTCGNRWTHSYSILTNPAAGIFGGTPLSDPDRSLPISRFTHRRALTSHGCFRCLPVASPPPPAPSAPPPPSSATPDLLDL